LRSDADVNAAAESADQVGWSRLNTRRGTLSGVSTNNSQHSQGFDPKPRGVRTPFNRRSKNPGQ
jgi:hypothetical protein